MPERSEAAPRAWRLVASVALAVLLLVAVIGLLAARRGAGRGGGAVVAAPAGASSASAAAGNAGLLGPPSPERVFAGLGGRRNLPVVLETDHGPIDCVLDGDRAPRGVSLFLALATGRARWREAETGALREDPLYRDLTFHRAIPGVLVQSGCPVGDGSGHPGYRIEVEAGPDDADRLRQPGALGLARYTPPPYRTDPHPPPPGHVLGSQFFIGLVDMSHLAGQVTVLGRCANLDRIASIARAVRRGDPRPRLERVTVEAR
ncbi:MAG: peptidylprolyl isomerase [Polyangiaceae bacterium]|nr:peptidylprolyl isomerase [Polyangiaceae bacterium]